MRVQIHLLIALLSLCGAGAARAERLAPQPFVGPPALVEEDRAQFDADKRRFPAAHPPVAAAPPSTATSCRPDGQLTRDGDDLSVRLVAKRGHNLIRAPENPDEGQDLVDLRSYGGCLTGPVIEAKPGSTVRVTLQNALDTKDPPCTTEDPASPACNNVINLHYHGLHVSPTGNSDNVLLNILPRTTFDYEVNIPGDHPSGTFWYHAHRHGTTAMQVASGASGALIIRGRRPFRGDRAGDIDTILHDGAGKDLPEKIFLFQQIPYACFDDKGNIITDPTVPSKPWICPKGHVGTVDDFAAQLDSPTVWDDSGRFTSINGLVQPVVSVAAGEIQRWRFIHAGIHDTVNLQIVPAAANASDALLTGTLAGTPKDQERTVQQSCPVTTPGGTSPADFVPQFEIAADGLTRTAVRRVGRADPAPGGMDHWRPDHKTDTLETNFLQPGYRSDVLVAFPHAGTYCILNQAAPADERASAGNGKGPGGQGPNVTQLLATVVVRGGTPISGDVGSYIAQNLHDANANDDPRLPPAALDGILRGDLTPWRGMPEEGPASNADHPRLASFFIGNLPGKDGSSTGPFGFWLNNKEYDPDRVDQTMQVNTTEDWMLTSYGEPHIFHIHVNPFEIMDVTYQGRSIYGPDGECLAKPDRYNIRNQYCGLLHTYKDTIFVQNDYTVHIRTTYDRYIGEFVIHCHILDHEDGGMMANIRIVPDLSAPGGGLGMPGMTAASDGTMTHHMH